MGAQQQPNQTTAVERAYEYTAMGSNEKIRLTINMIRNHIAVPTKKGHLPSDRDCIKFAMLCRGKRANPFEGDCYMIGYDGQDGPVFSMISGKDLFGKRAEQNENYNGYENGVIVRTADKQIERREGTLVFESEGEKLLGGWCKVYRKDRDKPFVKEVKFATYNTGMSRWKADPEGMIAKVAWSQAHREAFPTALGGFYTPEEMGDTGNLLTSDIEPERAPIEMPTPRAETPPPPQDAARKESKRQPRERSRSKEQAQEAQARPEPTPEEAEHQRLVAEASEAMRRLNGDDLVNQASDAIIHRIAEELKLDVDLERWPDDALKLLIDAVTEALEKEIEA